MSHARRDRFWETWSEEDFKFTDGLVGAAQEELAVVSSRSLNSEFRERASRVELLLRAASMMMRPDWDDHANYVKNKVEIALGSAFGMEIVYRQDSFREFEVDDE